MDRMLYFLLSEKLTFFRKENRNLIERLSLLLRGKAHVRKQESLVRLMGQTGYGFALKSLQMDFDPKVYSFHTYIVLLSLDI